MKSQSRPRMKCVFAIAAVFACTACGAESEQMMAASGTVPAASGRVTTAVGENENTTVKVQVKHLAPPGRIAPEASVYVVWIRASQGAFQNVGALRIDDQLVGTLETISPHENFTLYVTPEASARATNPTNDPVFTSEVRASD